MPVCLSTFAIPLTTTPVADILLGYIQAIRDLFVGDAVLMKLVKLSALIGDCPHTYGTPLVLQVLIERMPQNESVSNLTKGKFSMSKKGYNPTSNYSHLALQSTALLHTSDVDTDC
jgi:hypothetical protein